MRGTLPPLPQYVLMARYLVKYRNSFTFAMKIIPDYAM
jgi:hypothetical protein